MPEQQPQNESAGKITSQNERHLTLNTTLDHRVAEVLEVRCRQHRRINGWLLEVVSDSSTSPVSPLVTPLDLVREDPVQASFANTRRRIADPKPVAGLPGGESAVPRCAAANAATRLASRLRHGPKDFGASSLPNR